MPVCGVYIAWVYDVTTWMQKLTFKVSIEKEERHQFQVRNVKYFGGNAAEEMVGSKF